MKQAAKFINGELAIGSIEGSLLSDFSIRKITIIQDSDTFLYAGEVRLDYSLMPVLRKEINIGLFSLSDVNVNIEQYQDSAWNFSRLMIEKPTEDDTSATALTWKIGINDITVRNLSANIHSLDTSGMIPVLVETGFRMNAIVEGENILASLDSMRVITTSPDFEIKEISGDFSKKGETAEWNDLKIQLIGSLLLSNGLYNLGERGDVFAEVELTPFDLSDIKAFIPDMQVNGSPDLNFIVEGDTSEYIFSIGISEGTQTVEVTGSISDFMNEPDYSLKIVTENVNVAYWTGNKDMDTDISGKIEIAGDGFDVRNNKMNLNALFGNLRYSEYSLTSLAISGSKDRASVSGNLSSATFAGDLALKYDLSDIFNDPAYNLLIEYSNLNLDNIPGIDSIETNLNGDLSVTGRGFDPTTLSAEMIFNSDHSTVMSESLGDFSIDAYYRKGRYDFNLTGFGKPYINLDIDGSGDINTDNRINFDLEPLDLSLLSEIAGLAYLNASGKIEGSVSGTPDSLLAIAQLSIDSIIYDTIRIESVRAEIEAAIEDKAISAKGNLRTGKISSGDMSLQSLEVEGVYAENDIQADVNLALNDSISAGLEGTIQNFDNPVFGIKNLVLRYIDLEWATPHDSATIILNENDIRINKLTLSSGDQSININGQLAFIGEEDLQLSVKNINLSTLPLSTFFPYNIAGIFNSEIRIRGTDAAPLIDARFSIDGLDLNGFEVDSIRTDISYKDNLAVLNGKVISGIYESVDLLATAPVRISFSDTIALLGDNPDFYGHLRLDSLNIEKLSDLLPLSEIAASGYADVDIEVGNTINDPLITGTIKLSEGSFEHTGYGVDYSDIQLFASIDSSTVGLDTLSLRTRKGNLALTGYISFENTDSLELNDYNIILKADDFQAVQSGSIELNFDSDLELTGTLGEPVFKGGIDINSSKLNIDYFSEFFSRKTDEPNPPLLIAAMRDTVVVSARDTAQTKSSFAGISFYSNLKGEAVVDIPGNTWVTGKDMNFELNGSIRAVKASEDINLFGELNIRRGYYKIYGRNFIFEKGNIEFTGSSDFNPNVDFEIVYTFRDIEKERRDLRLMIAGRLMQPELRFMLDEDAIEEKDAISYIVFGKSVNQLGEGERDKLSGQDVAMGAAVTQLSSVLKGVLQESAGVDLFEVSGGDDWRSGNVTIGKYITNNLFLSYDRSFDFNKRSKSADTERIMLEYQIFRKLMLKATNQDLNSGFDLILRKTWR